MKSACARNYNRYNVEGKQELCPFNMCNPHGNAFSAGSSQGHRLTK